MIFSFADVQVDSEQYELYRDGELVSVEPQVFDLIVFLIEHPNRIFSRDELIDNVWRGRLVSDATVSSAIKSARKVLGDDGKTQRYIKTVHGRGFRFIADIGDEPTRRNTEQSVDAQNLPQLTDPSLIILPFRVADEESKAREFVNCIAANLETILTRVPLLNISTQASHFDPASITARQIYQQLGISYVVDGFAQKLDKQLTINVHLSDAKSGFRLWSEQFEQPLSFDKQAQDSLITAILTKLEPQLNRAIFENIRSDTPRPNSRQLYLHASSILAIKGWHQKTFLEAAALLRQSRDLDPNFALAPAYLSLVLALGHRVGLLADRKKTRHETVENADNALELDNLDSTVLGFAGCALADIGLLQRAFPILKNAIQKNSANAQAWTALGSAYLIDHQTQKAIDHLSHGITISPMDSRLSIWQAVLALAYLQAKNFQKACDNAELACQHDDKTYMPRVVLAGVYAAMKNHQATRAATREAYRIKPDLSESEIKSIIGPKLTVIILQQVSG